MRINQPYKHTRSAIWIGLKWISQDQICFESRRGPWYFCVAVLLIVMSAHVAGICVLLAGGFPNLNKAHLLLLLGLGFLFYAYIGYQSITDQIAAITDLQLDFPRRSYIWRHGWILRSTTDYGSFDELDIPYIERTEVNTRAGMSLSYLVCLRWRSQDRADCRLGLFGSEQRAFQYLAYIENVLLERGFEFPANYVFQEVTSQPNAGA